MTDTKLTRQETMKNIGNVFEKMDTLKQKVNEMEGTTEDNEETNTGETPNPRAAFENLPNMENLQSH